MEEEKEQSGDVLVSEMSMVKSTRQFVGEIIALFVMFSFVLFFVLLAILTLVLFPGESFIGSLASLGWLALVLCVVWCVCKYEGGGVRHSLRFILGIFSRTHFAAVSRQAEGWDALCFGYKLFGRRFYLLKIKCDGIRTVDWSMGQASGLSGQDANDWSVVVWYGKRQATKGSWDRFDKHDLGLYLISPGQAKTKTEEFGNRFVAFLRDASVPAAQKELPEPEVLEEMSAEVVNKNKIYVDGYGEFDYRSTKGHLKSGTKVRGIENRGLSLYVEPVEPEEMDDSIDD
ncbi:MAG: hypothetical protein ACYSPJ_08110 [Planctomycetota bacterium]